MFLNVGDKVTVMDSPEVPEEWRGVSATVSQVHSFGDGDGGLQQKNVTVVNQKGGELDTQSCLIAPRSH